MRSITMDESLSIILNCFQEAKRLEAYALAAIVLDAGGRVKAFLKQDGASIMRFEIARGKAFAALALQRSSRMVLQKSREKPLFMDTLREIVDGPIFLEAGGAAHPGCLRGDHRRTWCDGRRQRSGRSLRHCRDSRDRFQDRQLLQRRRGQASEHQDRARHRRSARALMRRSC